MIKGRHGYMVYNQNCQWIGKALDRTYAIPMETDGLRNS